LPSVGGAALPDLTEYELPVVGGSIPSPGGSPRNPTGLPSMAAEVPDFDMAPPRRGRAPAVDDGGFALSHAPQPPSISFDVPASDQAAGDDLFGDGPAPAPASAPPRRSSDPGAFGEVDLDSAPASAGDDVEEFDAFPTEAARPAAGTSANYGDVSLDGGGGELGLGADLERAPAPQGPAPAASAQVELPGRETAEAPAVKAPRSGLSKGARVAIVGSVVLAVAGGALGALSPRIGPYGAYAVMDFVQADSHAAALAADVKSARALLDADSVTALEEAFARVDAGRSSAPRHEARAAYAAYLGLLRQLRFGRDASIGPAAQVLLDGLAEASPAEVEHLALARVAGLAAAANPLEAVAQAKGHEAENIDYAALLGEVALLARDLPTAELAWKAALGHSRSARSHFGMARTQLHKGDRAGARTSADAALALSSGHVGALLLVTEIEVSERKLDEELVLRLTPIVEGQAKASDGERVLAMILLGDLHMARSRVKKAEESFTRALAIEAGSAAAQRGLADAIFASGRYGEAQTRYEAALKADPGSLPAGVGLVRCKLRLEQLEEAGKLLAALQTQHPESTIVQYWMGRAKELVGDRAAAQAAYEKAIALAQNSEELVQSYVSLTRLLGQAGRAEEAAVVIAQAEQKFPSDPLVYEALAELSLGRGSFEDAVRDYDRALALDPKNVGLHFARGVALRQARRFDEAFKEFELVEKESKDYPGLALERGNLYEASGRSEEALRAYEAALAVAPEDPDLMLRVGCGRAQAGASEDGLKLLEQVQKSRPNSAEVNFCLGLAYLHMDGRLPDARRHLNRAVGFDGSRATYHLYVGWVALELADYPTAARSLDKALELDRTLADAYWKRGEMLVRQGAVADAELDLRRALELSPTRTEAHAELAKAYAQLGEEPKALVEWALACVGAGAKAYDHYQYGRLLLDNRRTAEAEVELRKAIEKVSPVEPAPMWRWEAHRLYASALGRRREALEHWQAFVDHGPRNSPYLKEAQREMAAILDMLGH
jgi:tetratricopeptide (TPR) repeat protein